MARFRDRSPGKVFRAADLLDLGSRAAVDQALSRQSRAGTIRRITRGLYDMPTDHPLLGRLSAPSDAVAEALASRDGTRIQPTGAAAANGLGLSDQVPMRAVYLTDGRSRRVQLGAMQIELRHASPRHMATAGRVSGSVIQALRWIGRRYVDERMIHILRRNLSDTDKAQLLQDLAYAPAWIADIMRRVAQPEGKP
ncbi:MAG: hypothetical protein GX595_01855 [Lentisphaerae bacterium]|nr:hypothetical protein [Lentisphaerota bacterium]